MKKVVELKEIYMMEVLSNVAKTSGIDRNKLYKEIGTNGNVAITAINNLIKMGLIREEKKRYYNRKELSITEKGQQTVEKLI